MTQDPDATRQSVTASNRLTARWARELGDTTTVIAGAGVWPLLAILAASGDESAAVELAEAAGIAATHGFVGATALIQTMNTDSIKSALGVWVDRRAPVRDAWLEPLPQHTLGELRGDGTDQARVDAWASDRTGGLVPTMPVEVNEETLILLATAIMVRTRWTNSFTVGALRQWNGTPSAAGQPSIVALVRRRNDPSLVHVSDLCGVTTVEIEGDGDISVHLVIGDAGASAAEVIVAGIDCVSDPVRWCRGIESMKDGDVFPGGTVTTAASSGTEPNLTVTTIPFDIDVSHDLLDTAHVFGLTSAMDASRGHFPHISDTPLAIQQAKQQARAAFTADGFEAAAVTAMGMAMGAAMPRYENQHLEVRVTFDRPFGFVAVHRPTGLVLVAGWVAEPHIG